MEKSVQIQKTGTLTMRTCHELEPGMNAVELLVCFIVFLDLLLPSLS